MMHILNIHLHYKDVPIMIREKFTFSNNELAKANSQLKQNNNISECVIVSTCNRTEIFTIVKDINKGKKAILLFLKQWFQKNIEYFEQYVTIKEQQNAERHLFRIVTGLDSLAVGETEILGQVTNAFLIAQDAKTTNTYFNELFKRAITFAKKMHQETSISAHSLSISTLATSVMKRYFPNENKLSIVIIGAGTIAQQMIEQLQLVGIGQITVVNRSKVNRKNIAEQYDINSAPLVDLNKMLKVADVVITATTARELIIDETDTVKNITKKTLFIDLAVPRNIAAHITNNENVHLYHLDQFKHIIAENDLTRKMLSKEIEGRICEEIDHYHLWLRHLEIFPIIRALREKGLAIQQTILQSINNKIPHLTEREKHIMEQHTKSIVNQLLKEPIEQVKEIRNVKEAMQIYTQIFNLDESLNITNELSDDVPLEGTKNEII